MSPPVASSMGMQIILPFCDDNKYFIWGRFHTVYYENVPPVCPGQELFDMMLSALANQRIESPDLPIPGNSTAQQGA